MTQEIYQTEKCAILWRQLICKRSSFFNVGGWTYDDIHGHEGSLSISLFSIAKRILLALLSRAAWQHRYYSTKVGH